LCVNELSHVTQNFLMENWKFTFNYWLRGLLFLLILIGTNALLFGSNNNDLKPNSFFISKIMKVNKVLNKHLTTNDCNGNLNDYFKLDNSNLYSDLSLMTVTVSSTNSPICEGGTLDVTLNGLPTTGVNSFKIDFLITGLIYSNTFSDDDRDGSQTITIDGYTGVLGDNLIKINDAEQDPMGTRDPLGLGGDVSFMVEPLPIGAISGASGVTICEEDTYNVTFTTTVGTGPYNLTINGNTFNNVVSGGTVTLTMMIVRLLEVLLVRLLGRR